MINFKSLLKITLASMAMCFAYFLLPKTEDLFFIIWALIISAMYFILLYILREIKSEDIEIFKKLTSRK